MRKRFDNDDSPRDKKKKKFFGFFLDRLRNDGKKDSPKKDSPPSNKALGLKMMGDSLNTSKPVALILAE